MWVDVVNVPPEHIRKKVPGNVFIVMPGRIVKMKPRNVLVVRLGRIRMIMLLSVHHVAQVNDTLYMANNCITI